MGRVIDLNKIERKDITRTYNVYRLDHDDWEDMFAQEVKSGKQMIIIDSTENIVDKLRTNSMKNSIFDPRFNVPVNIDDTAIDCVCECGKLYGRYNEGETCKACDTKVEMRYELELSKHGWIDIAPYKIILPSMYNKLISFIGRKKFETILHVDSLDNDKVDPKNPFASIGMMEFERRFTEIMEYYNRSTKKPELFKEIMLRKDLVFTSKIYVMSSALRPGFASLAQNNFKFHSINGFFVKILTDMNLIRTGRRTGRQQISNILENVQNCVMEIHDLAFYKTFGNKKKLARSGVISVRKWYSSRHVIISESTTKDIDSVRISYKGFINQFELEIINAMMSGCTGVTKFMNMTMLEAKLYMKKLNYLNRIDEDIWDICMSLIKDRKDDGLWIIVNRNPSLDLGSIQTMRIVDLMPDVRDLVLSIPHNSLVEFCGDFDGDALNGHSPKERCVKEAFKEFRPSKLILDRTGNYFNAKMVPIKDETVFIKNMADPIFGEQMNMKLKNKKVS